MKAFLRAISGVLTGILTLQNLPMQSTAQEFAGEKGHPADQLEWISCSADGSHFEQRASRTRFLAWGVNYDHDRFGRLLEDYWDDEWKTVEDDFSEMKALGANVVRVHFQIGKFMRTPRELNRNALSTLAKLIRLAEMTGLYLDITGLGCYHKADVPPWYDALSEQDRWDVQARFWQAVATVGKDSPAIFCYDLMNEPILPGVANAETDWLAGEFGGSHFVQRIALDLAGRSREQVAKVWVEKLTAAIRRVDDRHLVTVGVIPWVHTFPNAKPLFYSPDISEPLDFVSVHFYPKKGEIDRALAALKAYEIGKPLVVEEMFPLSCGADELEAFIDASRSFADGWISFYWGKTISEYAEEQPSMSAAITRGWLERFQRKGVEILSSQFNSGGARSLRE